MRIMIATTPMRPTPTDFPPLGSLSVLSHLKRNGYSALFLHIDATRPAYEEVLAAIIEARPDVLGISSVVSTAYAYTKRLSLDVKAALPDTLIVLGGNLAASAEVILRRTGVDLCVLGEGEATFLSVVRRAEATYDPAAFADIPGLMLLNADGKLVNTGFPQPLPKEEIYDIDWSILEGACDPTMYFPVIDDSPEHRMWFWADHAKGRTDLMGKRLATLPGAKGCVARCTFCHRWEKGIRYIPVDLFMRRLDALRDRYDIGFLAVADENFGTDKRWLTAFCEEIKKRNILWRVGGMRVNCIDPDYIAMMKDSGCVSIIYGMETGSERMLQVMEKKTRQDDNRNAMRWTVEAGLWTVIQLVVGMPGETSETVKESIAFCKEGMSLSPRQNPNDTSINYAQALPGTPLYEYGRRNGLIGATLDAEEAYLERISDRDAHDEFATLNFTDVPALVCQTWRPRITVETNFAYVQKHGLDHYRRMLLDDAGMFRVRRPDSGYFANPRRLVESSAVTNTLHENSDAYELDEAKVPPLFTLIRRRKLGLALLCYPVLAYRLRRFLGLLILLKALQNGGPRYPMRLVGEYLRWLGHRLAGTDRAPAGYRSLRKVLDEEPDELLSDSAEMMPLRRGR